MPKITLFFLSILASGCIIIDDGKSPSSPNDTGWQHSTESETETETTDPTQPQEDHNGSFYLSPNAAPSGVTFITSVRSDQQIDWNTIDNIQAFGDIEICQIQPLYDEILLTIRIERDVPEAPVDFLIEYTDGDVDFIENGLYIDYESDIGSAQVGDNRCD